MRALAIAVALTSLALPRVALASVEDAEKALRTGDYPTAEKAFRAALRGGDRARATDGLARTLLETGRTGDAARAGSEQMRAEALYASGDRQAAVEILGRLAKTPEKRLARLWLGRLLSEAGDTSGARAALMPLVEDYNADRIAAADAEGLAYVAEAVHLLGAFRDANDAFRESWRADSGRAETQVRWAALFLEKYDAGHAEECLQDALEVNPRHAEAHLMYARVKMEQGFDFPGANGHIDAALETNPGLAGAHAMRAELALYDQDDAGAARHLEMARRTNPSDLATLAVAAGARWMVDDLPGLARARTEALRASPRGQILWDVFVRLADWEHRYDEIVPMLEEALRTDTGAENATVRAHLGLNRLRSGDEAAGLQDLQLAWRRDRYNVLVKNTLDFHENVVDREYETLTLRRYRLRVHKAEKAILERYVPRMLDRAWDDMVRRYGFTPQGPVQIELYADTQHFALRTSGLPDIGVQGVCFGKVVTAISPKGGPFNWGQIVWHELAHVFAIQLSRQRVPRWFTEGLAEWETIVARPEWVRENDDDLYRALAGGHLPPVARLNDAFTHARSTEEVMVAYYAASQVVKYVIDRFGFAKAIEMLRLWGAGKRTPQVIREALGVSPEDLDRDFRRSTLERLARYANDFRVASVWAPEVDDAREAATAAPDDALRQVGLGTAFMRVGKTLEAKEVFERVLARDPRRREALYSLAQIGLETRDFEAVRRHGRALLATGTDSYGIRMMLAGAARGLQDDAGMGRQLCHATRVAPDQKEAQDLLREWLSGRGREDRALDRLRTVVRLDQHDREAMSALLGKLRTLGRRQEVIEFGERALYLDPHNVDVHVALAEAYEAAGRTADAIFEYESALLCEPEDPAPIQNAIDRLRGRSRRRI